MGRMCFESAILIRPMRPIRPIAFESDALTQERRDSANG